MNLYDVLKGLPLDWMIFILVAAMVSWSAWKHEKLGKVGKGEDDVCKGLLGLGTASIKPGMTCEISSRSQLSFRSTRLLIPSNIASCLLVEDIQIAKHSQLLNSMGVPGEIFGVDQKDPKFRMDELMASADFVIRVVNISDHDIIFSGVVIGEPLIDGSNKSA